MAQVTCEVVAGEARLVELLGDLKGAALGHPVDHRKAAEEARVDPELTVTEHGPLFRARGSKLLQTLEPHTKFLMISGVPYQVTYIETELAGVGVVHQLTVCALRGDHVPEELGDLLSGCLRCDGEKVVEMPGLPGRVRVYVSGPPRG